MHRDAGPQPASPSASAGWAEEFDAFLSYSTVGDYFVARRVESFLESFHDTAARSGEQVRALRVCRDGSDFRQPLLERIRTEDAIWQRILSSLTISSKLVVLCSPEAIASSWVARELQWAIANKSPGSVLLAVTSGADPSGTPETVFPPVAIAAGLPASHLWYDLRQWRGSKGDRVRDAEDELVRLAVDLLGPHGARPDIGAIWQREDLKRKRRALRLGLTATVLVLLGTVTAAWQFVEARLRAEEARASSLTRIAEAGADRTPLLSTLAYAEIDPERGPPDALGVGYRLMDAEIPRARLRGQMHAIVDAAWMADGDIVSIDKRGDVFRGHADGAAPFSRIIAPAAVDVRDTAFSPDARVMTIALSNGEVGRWRDGIPSARCATGGDDVRKLVVSPDGQRALLMGNGVRAYWCDFSHAGTTPGRTLELSSALAGAWPEAGDSQHWLAVTDRGDFWRIDMATGDAQVLAAAASAAALAAAGIVRSAVAGAAGIVAIQAGDDVLVGRSDAIASGLHKLPLSAATASLAFSPDGLSLGVATADGRVSLFDASGLQPPRMLGDPTLTRADTSTDDLLQLAWSPRGERIALLQYGFGVRVWELALGAPAQPLRLQGNVGASALRWSPQGDRVATLGDDGSIEVWDAHGDTRGSLVRLPEALYAAAVDASSGDLAVGTREGSVVVFGGGRLDAAPATQAAGPACGAGQPSRAIALLRYEREGGRLWAAGRDGLVRRLPARGDAAPGASFSYCAPDAKQFGFSEQARGVVFVDAGGRLGLVDRTGAHQLDSRPTPSPVSVLTVSRDGRWAAAGMEDGTLVRWDLATSPVLRQVERPHSKTVLCIAFDDHTGAELSVAEDGVAVLGEPGRASPAHWQGDGKWLETCAFDGDTALVSSESGRIWLLDRSHAGRMLPLSTRMDSAHIGSVNTALIPSQAGLAVTGGGVDGRVEVWGLRSRRIAGAAAMTGAVTSIVQSRVNGDVYVVDEGGSIRRLPLDVGGVQRALRERNTAELTPLERRDLLGEPDAAAYEGYARRERSHGRVPLPADWQFDIPS